MDQIRDTGRRTPAVTTSPAVATAPTVTPPTVTRLRLAISLFFALDGFVFAGWVVRIPAVKEQIHASAGALGLALLGVSWARSPRCCSPASCAAATATIR